jgi:FixJ family two-component response regulator
MYSCVTPPGGYCAICGGGGGGSTASAELRDQLHWAMTARIAIIDDDADVRESTRQLLRSRGFLTLVFASAEDFLKSGEVIQASCVVTDVRMPGMSGVALQAWLRAQGSTIPMIFVTAFPEPKTQAQVLAAGAHAYLEKPYQAAILIDCIEAVLKD